MNAICISSDLKLYLDSCSKEIATVHSVYKSVINIVDNSGQLITILIDQTDIQPMSVLINTKGCLFSAVEVGDDVILSCDSISISRCNILIKIESTEHWEPGIKILNSCKSLGSIEQGYERLKNILIEQNDEIGLSGLINRILFYPVVRIDNPNYPVLNQYCDFIQERIVNLLGFIGARNFNDALDEIPRIIGFGSGLTPSSDDVLCGMLAVIGYASKLYHDNKFWADAIQFSIKAYELSVGKTTVVSEQMLMHAKHGSFPESYHAFMRSLFLEKQISIDEAAMEVLKRGASSGKDFLFGVYCMGSIILNLWDMPHRR